MEDGARGVLESAYEYWTFRCVCGVAGVAVPFCGAADPGHVVRDQLDDFARGLVGAMAGAGDWYRVGVLFVAGVEGGADCGRGGGIGPGDSAPSRLKPLDNRRVALKFTIDRYKAAQSNSD